MYKIVSLVQSYYLTFLSGLFLVFLEIVRTLHLNACYDAFCLLSVYLRFLCACFISLRRLCV